MLEFLFWAWAVVAILAFLWTGPWIIKNLWNNEIELFAFVAWPVLCALVPFILILGFMIMGWEKITGKEIS
jgi:hypothetical protein